MTEPMHYSTEKAVDRDSLLASTLEKYCDDEYLEEEVLAALLGVDLPDYLRLGQCRRPENVAEVQEIAEKFGIETNFLTKVIGIKATRKKPGR